MNRRSFLKRIGLGVAAVAAAPALSLPSREIVTRPSAPLFVPSERLDYGVPTQRLVLSTNIEQAIQTKQWTGGVGVDYRAADGVYVRTDGYAIPMLLKEDNYLREYGGRLRAGAQIMVDRTTALRWTARGVAVPGPSAPRDIQERSAQREAERAQRQRETWDPSWTWGDMAAGERVVPQTSAQRNARAKRKADADAGWDRLVASARQAGLEVG